MARMIGPGFGYERIVKKMAMNLPDLNSRRFSQWLLALLVLVCLGGVALMVSGGSSRTPDDSVAGKTDSRQSAVLSNLVKPCRPWLVTC